MCTWCRFKRAIIIAVVISWACRRDVANHNVNFVLLKVFEIWFSWCDCTLNCVWNVLLFRILAVLQGFILPFYRTNLTLFCGEILFSCDLFYMVYCCEWEPISSHSPRSSQRHCTMEIYNSIYAVGEVCVSLILYSIILVSFASNFFPQHLIEL